MNKLSNILLIILVVILSYVLFKTHKISDNSQQWKNTLYKLDSIKAEQQHIRDSINKVNDTITTNIYKIHSTYEKNVQRVISQSVDSDWWDIKNYLSRFTIDSTGLKEIKFDSIGTR